MKQLILSSLLFVISSNIIAQNFEDKPYEKRHLRLTIISPGLEFENHFTKEQSLVIATGYMPKFVNQELYVNDFFAEAEYRRYNRKQINRGSLFTFFHGARFLYAPDLTFGVGDSQKHMTYNFGYNPGYLFKYKFVHLLFSLYLPLSYDAQKENFFFMPTLQFNLGINIF